MSTDSSLWQEIVFQRTIDKSVPATEMLKVCGSIYFPIFGQLFQLMTYDYSLRQFWQLYLTNVQSVFLGTRIISFIGPKLWNIVSNEFKKKHQCFQETN